MAVKFWYTVRIYPKMSKETDTDKIACIANTIKMSPFWVWEVETELNMKQKPFTLREESYCQQDSLDLKVASFFEQRVAAAVEVVFRR